jgi:cell division protein FtsI (penicillin-binding protein 3)
VTGGGGRSTTTGSRSGRPARRPQPPTPPRPATSRAAGRGGAAPRPVVGADRPARAAAAPARTSTGARRGDGERASGTTRTRPRRPERQDRPAGGQRGERARHDQAGRSGGGPRRRAPRRPGGGGGRGGSSGSGGRQAPVDPRRRAISLLVVFGLLFAIVVVRLADVQVVRSGRYVTYGEDQRIAPVVLPAGRGTIFDRNDNELAMSMPQKTVYADPRLVPDPEVAARRLAGVLDVDRAELEEKLASDSQFVYVARRVDDEVADRVERLDIPGISFLEEPERFNPGGQLAASLLGRVGVDNEGLSGLEQRFDDELTGTPGELIRELDPEGHTIPAGRQHIEPAEPGDDLVLTLDRGLQYEVERVLGDQVRAVGARGGIAIVSQPETGEILALANLESDPATGQVASTGNNLAVTSNFEPGSVNKVITMAAALEEGVVTPETVMRVPDTLQVADHTFSDSHSHPTEDYTVTRVLAESSNVGTIEIAQQVGADRLDEYLRRFGFGESTALDLPHEEEGQLLDPDDWYGTSIGSIPIGQGISVTAMQMLYAYNTIANDGVYLPPTLLQATVDADGERRPVEPADGRRVVSPTTARQVQAMLAEAVASGTGTAAAIEGYQAAGKTGTARKPQPGGGYTDENGQYHHMATFAGFIPAGDPKVSIIVVIDEPSTSPYAGDVAAPAFAEIGRYALRQLRIPPSAADRPQVSIEGPLVRSDPAAPAATVPPTTTTTAPTTTTTAAGGAARQGVRTTRPPGLDPDRRTGAVPSGGG